MNSKDPSKSEHTEHSHPPSKRMINLRPTESLGERFPAMHLVRSSWFARMLSRLLFIVLIGLVFAGFALPWQQTSRCEGEVVARLPQLRSQSVQSGTKGVIKRLKDGIREGELVQEGDLIMEIEPYSKDEFLQLELQKKQYEFTLELSEKTLENTKKQRETDIDRMKRDLEAVEFKVNSTEEKRKQASAKILAQEGNYQQAKNELESVKDLRTKTISEIEYLDIQRKEIVELNKLVEAKSAERGAEAEYQEAKKTLAGKRKDLETKTLDLTNDIQKAEAEVAKNKNALSETLVKLGESTQLEIKSPSTGRIQAIFGQAGVINVKEGDKLFEVIPDTSDLAVELIVRGNDYPLIVIDDEVRLQFEGWPAIQFVGWPSVAVGTFGGRVIAKNPSVDSKGNFKIMVSPDPNQPSWPDSEILRQGVRANGWVILRTVPLGFEIWRQLNGFPPGKSEPGTEKEKAKDPKLPKFK